MVDQAAAVRAVTKYSLAEQAPDANLIEVPEGDDFPMRSAPAAFERILRRR